MRSLLSAGPSHLSDDDLAAIYAFPDVEPSWVRAVFIATADGAAQGGDLASASLSGPGDRRIFGFQRSLCDVVLVGAGTARVERYRPVHPSEVDSDLRRRLGLAPVPAIAVVSRSLTFDAELLGGEAPTIVVTTEDAPEPAVADLAGRAEVVRSGVGDVDLAGALDALALSGHRRVLCEGGPTLLAQLVAAGRLDDLCLTIAPMLVAGDRHRILRGPGLDPVRRLRLTHLLQDDDELFARYLVDRSA